MPKRNEPGPYKKAPHERGRFNQQSIGLFLLPESEGAGQAWFAEPETTIF